MPRGGNGSDPSTPRHVALCVLALVAFNFPLLAVFDSDLTVFGLPLLPVAVFSLWGGLILALAWVSEGRVRRLRGRPPDPEKERG